MRLIKVIIVSICGMVDGVNAISETSIPTWPKDFISNLDASAPDAY